MKNILFFLLLGILVSLSPAIECEAREVYCSTQNGIDYYVETTDIGGTRSGMIYSSTHATNGEWMLWCFDNYKNQGWKFMTATGRNRSSAKWSDWKFVAGNALANNVLYVTQQEMMAMR